jgi:hypothetical protein
MLLNDRGRLDTRLEYQIRWSISCLHARELHNAILEHLRLGGSQHPRGVAPAYRQIFIPLIAVRPLIRLLSDPSGGYDDAARVALSRLTSFPGRDFPAERAGDRFHEAT